MTDSLFSAPLSITVAILGIIQGVAWAILSLLAILIHYDVFVPEINTSPSYAHLLSFRIVSSYLSGDSLGSDTLYIHPQTFGTWAILYLLVSLIWVLLSAYQIWATVQQKEKFIKMTFLGWSSWTLIICICDVIFTCFLAVDYDALVRLINLKTTVTVEDHITILACGIMMTIAARGFVCWFINISFAIITMTVSYQLCTKPIEAKRNDTNIIQAFGNTNGNKNWEEDAPNFNQGKSYLSSKTFGTFQGLPRLAPVQSTNELLTKLARTGTMKSEASINKIPTRSNNYFLYSQNEYDFYSSTRDSNHSVIDSADSLYK